MEPSQGFGSGTQFEAAVFSSSPSSAMDVDGVQRKIASFAELEEGWDFGAGRPSPPKVVAFAQQICEAGKWFAKRANAFPGVDGGIVVAFYLGDNIVDVTVNTDLTLDYVHERGTGVEYEELACGENVKWGFISAHLAGMNKQANAWNSSEPSIWQGTTHTEDDSAGTPLRIWGAESRSLMLNVPAAQQNLVFALT
ncbi:unnamed protein product [marine sediment metagenome]|uniref:Uncharacterized protein n=1 Tax=marine sediment metagenome TaxID=412755 RepID=X0TQZ0_9ZZZZ